MVWRRWLKLERLIPSATILLAFAAQALDLLGIINLDVGDQIILVLIALIAIDALTERLSTLEKIRADLKEMVRNRARASDFLHPRSKLPPLDQELSNAQSFDIAGPSLLGVATQCNELLLKKAGEGCRIRLLLLNHKNEKLVHLISTFIGNLTPEIFAQEIITSLNALTGNPTFLNSGSVQIRICNYPFAHGLLIINGDKPYGKIRVEVYVHGRRPPGTLGFFIQKIEDPGEFNIFWQEFNEMWNEATPYHN